MSRTRSFLEGMVSSYAYQFAVMGVGIWLTPFLLRTLGQHDYGLWLVGMQMLTYLSLIDFGVVALLPREVAYGKGRADCADVLAPMIRKVTKVVLCQSLLVGCAALLMWILMPASWNAMRGPLGWILAAFSLMFPLRIFSAVLEGLQELAFISQIRLASWVVSTVVTIALISKGAGLTSLAAGWIANQILIAGAAAWKIAAGYPQFVPRLSGAPPLTFADFTRGAWVSVGQVAQLLLNGIDVMLISHVLGPAAVVPYACTNKLAGVLANHPHLIVHTALPGLSEMRTSAPRERILKAASALCLLMLLLSGLLAVVVLAVNEGFTRWWVGDAQFGGMPLTIAIVAAMVARHLTHTLGYTLFCFGYERRTAISAVVEGAVNFVLAVILTPRVGMIGIPIAGFASTLLVALPVGLVSLSKELGVPMIQLMQPFFPWALRLAVLVPGALLMAHSWTPHGPVALGAAALAATAAYAALMIPLLWRPPLAQYMHSGLPKLRAWGLAPATE